MKLLALDTSTEACSAALLLDGVTSARYAVLGRGHAERLLPMVDELLAEAGMALTALDAIAFGRGPGAFTGVRIATSVAQGLAFGADLPLVPISTLAALALQALERGATEGLAGSPGLQALACLDARMGEVYAALAQRDDALGVVLRLEALRPPEAVVPEGLAQATVGAGHGFRAYPAIAHRLGTNLVALWPDLLPRAEEVAALGVRAFRAGLAVDPAAASPVYLRDEVASQSGRRQP